jgi:hypothetical protein
VFPLSFQKNPKVFPLLIPLIPKAISNMFPTTTIWNNPRDIKQFFLKGHFSAAIGDVFIY